MHPLCLTYTFENDFILPLDWFSDGDIIQQARLASLFRIIDAHVFIRRLRCPESRFRILFHSPLVNPDHDEEHAATLCLTMFHDNDKTHGRVTINRVARVQLFFLAYLFPCDETAWLLVQCYLLFTHRQKRFLSLKFSSIALATFVMFGRSKSFILVLNFTHNPRPRPPYPQSPMTHSTSMTHPLECIMFATGHLASVCIASIINCSFVTIAVSNLSPLPPLK
jgi:hypothetical protein